MCRDRTAMLAILLRKTNMSPEAIERSAPQDAARINADDPREVRYWTTELGVDERTLRAAVEQVGPWAAVIRQHLRSNHGRG